MANALDVRIDLPTDDEINKMFDAVPLLVKHDVLKATTKAGAAVVARKAKEYAPRGTEKDRRKRSKSQLAKANWNIRLHTTIRVVTRGGQRVAFSVVGPKHPEGNKVWFNQGRKGSRKHILWGKDVGRTYHNRANWIKRAFDESQPEQLRAMKEALTKKVKEMLG